MLRPKTRLIIETIRLSKLSDIALAKSFNVSRQYIARLRIEHDIPRNISMQTVDELTPMQSLILSLILSGYKTKDICIETGCTVALVYKVRNKLLSGIAKGHKFDFKDAATKLREAKYKDKTLR
jgi:DNA-binding NarL/FixJ family response regulator